VIDVFKRALGWRSVGAPFCVCALLLIGAVPDSPARAAPSLPAPPSIAFEKYRLANGLEVILHRDPTLPLVAVNLWYHVGPANEPKGRSGFAHLFEHLMFEGSKHVGRRFDTLLEAAGATNVNGTTSWDRTNYFETVPREQLELVLWIESDRMGYMLDTLSRERLDVQRGVVKNERRQSFDDAPYGPSTLAVLDTLFPAGHPYHGAVIGSMKDLSAATLKDVREFFTAFYAPSNATLAIAGDFEPRAVKGAIEKYFGSLPTRARPNKVRHRTPPLTRPRRLTIGEPVELAKVTMAWITPPAYDKDEAALSVAQAVLAGGKATRLYRALIVEQKLASEVDASLDANALASAFDVSAIAASDKSAAELEPAMDAVLDELAKGGPSAAELDRAKRRLLVELMATVQLLNGPGGETGRAGLLQRYNHYLGDPGYLAKDYQRLVAVSADDVRRVVRTHLSKQRRLTVVTRPKGAGKKP
jgi:zinc protease